MSIGLLCLTHQGIAEAFLEVVHLMLGPVLPLKTLLISIPPEAQLDPFHARALHYLQRLDQGEGVLVLTDLPGSTPANIASRLRQSTHRIEVISGLNLPMLLRIYNYPQLTLSQLALKALTAGQEGICQPDPQRTPIQV